VAKFQILSLIGGGIRGAFVTSYLKELEQKLGRPIAESFDLIAGTSTGGIIAAGLAFGLSAERYLFPPVNWIFKKKTGGGLHTAFRARYCPFALEKSFDLAFGDHTLGDINCTRLIMPAVNLTKGGRSEHVGHC